MIARRDEERDGNARFRSTDCKQSERETVRDAFGKTSRELKQKVAVSRYGGRARTSSGPCLQVLGRGFF
eukprot:1189382-Prorocentrum_minimum.AAC.2